MPDELKAIEIPWKWLAACVSLVSAAFGVGVARSKVAMKSELYNKDGSSIYVPRNEFEKVTDRLNEVNHTLGRIEQFMEDHAR